MTNSKAGQAPKKLLFSITRDDFEWQYFRAGGKGGQNQNKVNSGVRCIHPLSNARGEARDSRDQLSNRRAAFSRCVKSGLFQAWFKKEIARRLHVESQPKPEDISAIVDAQMTPENLRIEEYDPTPGKRV